ncbi:hypothetical protein H0H92_013423 [Tricholoma furcatifolium]|nr:hypothetical protein H0H92_013423 [Tricholoma furcatifolium]
MAASISSAREGIKSLQERTPSFDLRDGISLISLKHHLLLSYLNSLVLMSSRRAIGHPLNARSQPDSPFSAQERPCRGSGVGDLVDSVIEGRVALEKIRTLEIRMRYQIEKLVRIAEKPEQSNDLVDGPLSFRPNPSNFADGDEGEGDSDNENEYSPADHPSQGGRNSLDADAIYRPPRVAPVPYTEKKSKSQLRKERPPIPSALASLSTDATRPHIESTSGLGGTPSLASGRAAYLKRLNEFEEENFSRVVMKKSDARRRARDEEDLALGGSLAGGSGKHRRRAGGLEDEFGDVLRSVERVSDRGFGGSGVVKGDGYEELRRRSKKADVLQRSRQDSRKRGIDGDDEVTPDRTRKRSRFELDAKNAKKRLKARK